MKAHLYHLNTCLDFKSHLGDGQSYSMALFIPERESIVTFRRDATKPNCLGEIGTYNEDQTKYAKEIVKNKGIPGKIDYLGEIELSEEEADSVVNVGRVFGKAKSELMENLGNITRRVESELIQKAQAA